MGNFYTYDEKAAYEQRYHSRRGTRTSYSSSNSSSNSCNDEKCEDCNRDPRASLYAFYNAKPLPPVPGSRDRDRRVRFSVQKPLPPLPKKRSSSRESEETWWASGRQGVYESDEEEEDNVEYNEKVEV